MKIESLKGKVAIVTGGGGAIGSAMCIRLAENGVKVVVAGRTLETLNKTVEEVKAHGGEAAAVTVDVSKMESAKHLIEETVRIYGRLDIMVNNAGINGGPQYRKRVHEYDEGLWDRIVSVDLDGVYNCSKFAIRAMTKTMAMELAPKGIRVNGIAPGSVMNEGVKELFYSDPVKSNGIISHFPVGHPGEPDDIAYATCYLASDEAKFMTGATMTVDGGWICGYNRDL